MQGAAARCFPFFFVKHIVMSSPLEDTTNPEQPGLGLDIPADPVTQFAWSYGLDTCRVWRDVSPGRHVERQLGDRGKLHLRLTSRRMILEEDRAHETMVRFYKPLHSPVFIPFPLSTPKRTLSPRWDWSSNFLGQADAPKDPRPPRAAFGHQLGSTWSGELRAARRGPVGCAFWRGGKGRRFGDEGAV